MMFNPSNFTIKEIVPMARRAHCPQCEEIVELPHECPHKEYVPENYGQPKYEGPRDDEGRPVGNAVKGATSARESKKIPPKFVDVKTDDQSK